MATQMLLGGVSLGPDFPLYSTAYAYTRDGEQGSSFRRVNITLNSFVEGEGCDAVMALYKTLRNKVGMNDTTFTYIQDSVTVHDNKKVWIDSYNEPEDNEYGKAASGDYSITLYYFENNNNDLGIPCSFGSYIFEKPPKWSRDFFTNKSTPYSTYTGLAKIGVITLSGHLFGETHSQLMGKIEQFQNAFTGTPQGVNGTLLTYGDFSKFCYVEKGSQINPEVIANFAYYDIKLFYYTGDIIDFSYKVNASRIHLNPVIDEKPFCNTRTIQLMNESGQTVTYTMSCTSKTLEKAKEIINTELMNAVEPGGVEMPGGDQDYDQDNGRVTVKVTKFYNNPVFANLGP